MTRDENTSKTGEAETIKQAFISAFDKFRSFKEAAIFIEQWVAKYRKTYSSTLADNIKDLINRAKKIRELLDQSEI